MISFVIPALNEAQSIAETVRRCRELAEKNGWEGAEVVVVDDGSTDGTGDIARAEGAQVVRHPAPGGYGRALKDGITHARNDTIAILDADGTYPIDRFPDLLARYGEGFDAVVGRRTGAFYRQSAFKSPLRHILRILVEFTTGSHVPDINSGMRVFSRAGLMPYFPRLCETFSFSTSMTLAYMMTGKFISYVDIDYFERKGRSKVKLFRDSLRTLQYILNAILFYNPLKIFLLVTLGCLFAAAMCMVLALLTKLLVFFLLGIGIAVASAIIFAIGLLAVQLREIMHG